MENAGLTKVGRVDKSSIADLCSEERCRTNVQNWSIVADM